MIAVQGLGRDLRQALRALARARGFSFVVRRCSWRSASPAAPTIFTLVERVLLRPLPFPAPERLVRVFETSPQSGSAAPASRAETWRAGAPRRRGSRGWRSATRWAARSATPASAEVVLAAQVTCDFLPAAGRVSACTAARSRADECRRASLQQRGDAGGRRPRRRARPRPVDAALRRRSRGRRTDASPSSAGPSASSACFRRDAGTARAGRAGVPGLGARGRAAARPALHDRDRAAATGRFRGRAPKPSWRRSRSGIAREHPETNRGWSVSLVPLHENATAAVRPVLVLLLAALGLVLLIACGNVAILFLARGAAAAREAALRLALGAAPGRVLRQGLVEAALLAAIGGALGGPRCPRWRSRRSRARGRTCRASTSWASTAARSRFAIAATAGGRAARGRAAGAGAWRGPIRGCAFETGRAHDAPAGPRSRPATRWWSPRSRSPSSCSRAPACCCAACPRLRAADPGFDPEGVLVAPIFLDGQEYGTGDEVARSTTRGCSSACGACRAWPPSAEPPRCPPARSAPTSSGRSGRRTAPATSGACARPGSA